MIGNLAFTLINKKDGWNIRIFMKGGFPVLALAAALVAVAVLVTHLE